MGNAGSAAAPNTVSALQTMLGVAVRGYASKAIDGPDVVYDLSYGGWAFEFVVGVTIGFFIIYWMTSEFFAKPVARHMLGKSSTTKRSVKFAQSIMEFIQYSVFFVFGARILYSQDWFWPSAQWWSGHSIGKHDSGPVAVAAFYLLYLCRYISNLFFVTFVDIKRKDFWEMFIHHAVTAVLVALSYMGCFWRVGLVIMVLLDIGDPPLHFAKMFKYMHEEYGDGIYIAVANGSFNVFGVVFFVTRLVMYGYVNWSCWSEGYSEAVKDGSPYDTWSTITFCNIMVSILYGLQCFWMTLLVKAAIRMSSTGEVQDQRSDSESEEGAKKNK